MHLRTSVVFTICTTSILKSQFKLKTIYHENILLIFCMCCFRTYRLFMANLAQFLQVASVVGFTVGPKAYAVLYLRKPELLGSLRFYGGGGEKDRANNVEYSQEILSQPAVHSNIANRTCLSGGTGVHSGDAAEKMGPQLTPVDAAERTELANNSASDNATITESSRFGGVYIGLEEIIVTDAKEI